MQKQVSLSEYLLLHFHPTTLCHSLRNRSGLRQRSNPNPITL